MKSLVIMLALVFVLSASADEFLTQLQALLQQERGSWTAAENSISRMSTIERSRMLGVLPNNMPDAGDEVIEETSREELRAMVECKNTSIKNQGGCGSCYAFGACATYEGWKLTTTGSYLDLSEQYFMMKAKSLDGSGYGGCNGWYLDTSMNLLKNYGTAAESACAYKGYEANCSSSASASYKIGSWSKTTSLSTIKSQLSKGPVYCAFAVYTDFTYYSGGIYTYKSGSVEGYHAVCIVGYDDAAQCFKVKNSWGTGWGESGYFRIAYSQMNNGVQFGTCFGGSYYINN